MIHRIVEAYSKPYLLRTGADEFFMALPWLLPIGIFLLACLIVAIRDSKR